MKFYKNQTLLKILKNQISFFFKDKEGVLKKVNAKEGQTILEIAHENNIEIEGACDA
jgi:ferredoxin